ncbi:AAA family ATPase [Scytonema sp. NUACC21]
MRHFEEITIQNFRGIQDLKLQGLGQINLLVGVNNSGKTSVLEAISAYCSPLDLRELVTTARQRERENLVDRIPTLDALLWMFPQSKDVEKGTLDQSEIVISSLGSFPVNQLQVLYQKIEGVRFVTASSRNRRMSLSNQNLDDDEDSLQEEIQQGIDLELQVHTNQLTSSGEKEVFTRRLQLWERDRLVARTGEASLNLPVYMITQFSHRTERVQARALTETRMSNFTAQVIHLLQKMDSGIIGLEILTPLDRPIVYVNHQQLGLAPLSTFGDGVRRLLFIATKLVKVRGGVLLIDEIETAIHTEALHQSFSWLIYWCREMDIQLFATTHSLEAIDVLLNATQEENDLVTFRLERAESSTSAVRLDQYLLHTLREELGQEVRK